MRSDRNSLFRKRRQENRADCDKRRGQPSRKMSAAAIILKPVILAFRRVIRVSRARHTAVIVAAVGVAVRNQQTERRSRGLSLKYAADNAERVALGTRSGKPVPRRTAQGKPITDELLIHGYAGGNAVQHCADFMTVAFPEQRDRQLVAECILHSVSPFRIASSDGRTASQKAPISDRLIS